MAAAVLLAASSAHAPAAGRVRRGVGLPVVLVLCAAATIAFLSVPDTEGVVLVGGLLVPPLCAAAVDRLPVGPRPFAAGVASVAAGLAAATAWGADGRVSVEGWWVPKLVALAVAVVSLVALATSARRRR